jgi:hypothetical protein
LSANPEQNNGAETGNSGQEDIQAAAERRRGLERTWTETYVTRTDVVPAAQTDALIEEGIAAGLFIRQEGTPDPNFVGDNVQPAPGKETEAGAILTGMRSNRQRYFEQPAVRGQLDQEYGRLSLSKVPAGMDPEVYVYEVARRAREAGVWKEATNGPRDGFVGGGKNSETYKGGKVLHDRFESQAKRLLRSAEDTRITARIGTDPADQGQNFARFVEQAVRDGKIEVIPKSARGAGKNDPPERYTFALAGGDEYASMSQVYLDAVKDAFGANDIDKPPKGDDFKAYMDTIYKKLPGYKDEGEQHIAELRQGVDTSAADAARARIEALNAEDQRFAPILDPAEVARLNRQRRATERREGSTYRVRGQRDVMGQPLYAPTARLYEEAYAQDTVAAAGGRAHNEFNARIDALQMQINTTTDRNLRQGLEEAMTRLREEQGQGGGDAQTRQAERVAENAQVLARDPAVAGRWRDINLWLSDPAVVAQFEASGQWLDDDPGGEWNQMIEIQREAARPLLNQAAMALRGGTREQAEEFFRQAFVATEGVRAEYEAKQERVRESNNEVESQILDASQRGQETSINLGRSSVSPEINQLIVNDARDRFNMPPRPFAVEEATGPNGEPVRDMVYVSPNRPNVALVVRYDLEGRMLSADVMIQAGGTTRNGRRGRVFLAERLRNRIMAADRNATPGAARVNFDAAGGGTGGGGGGGDRDADWSGYRGPGLPAPRSRRQFLESTGMPPETAEQVTAPRRRTGWRRLLFGA